MVLDGEGYQSKTIFVNGNKVFEYAYNSCYLYKLVIVYISQLNCNFKLNPAMQIF